jgi:ribosomal protein S3
LQSYKTDIFQNAYIFSSKLGGIISQGLNLTHFLHLVAHKIQYLTRCAPIAGIGLILTGRIKGHMKTRFVSKMNALCVSSTLNRILDIGYISSVSSLGSFGVKVGIIH